MGALPFPGIPGFHMLADPHKLGQHRFRSTFSWLDEETDRGIIYTTRGGFIDIAHVREWTDWTAVCTRRARTAMDNGQTALRFRASNHTWVRLTFNYPPGWNELPTAERHALIDDVSRCVGQQCGYALSTWHEVITWFGYTTVPMVTERPSAFTYDDMVSHMLGLQVAADALADTSRDYNQAVTHALGQRLTWLGAVDVSETKRAVAMVKGKWWRPGVAIRRQLHTCYVDGQITPMLVPGFSEDQPQTFRLPTLAEINGPVDVSGMCTIKLEPHMSAWREIRRLLGDPSAETVVPERDLPRIIDIIAQQMRETIDPNVDAEVARTASR